MVVLMKMMKKTMMKKKIKKMLLMKTEMQCVVRTIPFPNRQYLSQSAKLLAWTTTTKMRKKMKKMEQKKKKKMAWMAPISCTWQRDMAAARMKTHWTTRAGGF